MSQGLKWIESIDSPYRLVYGVVMILCIVYSSLVPAHYRTFADSLVGRSIGLFFMYIILRYLGWGYAVITSLAFLLIIHNAPRNEGFKDKEKEKEKEKDGFEGGGSVTSKEVSGKRWFVEQLLGEKPVAIETDRVTTYPIDK